jgi:ATP-dependent Zn protease
MDLFFRSALFPLIVIGLLVYLGTQTLRGEDETRLPYSEVKLLVSADPERVEELTFRPNDREVVVKLTDGTRIKADYPRASTSPVFAPPSAEGAVRENRGSSWAWGLTPLLPFALLFALVIVLASRRQGRISNEDLRAP